MTEPVKIDTLPDAEESAVNPNVFDYSRITKENIIDYCEMIFTVNADGRPALSDADREREIQRMINRAAELYMKTDIKAYLKRREKLLKQEIRKAEKEKTALERNAAAEDSEKIAGDFYTVNQYGTPCKPIDQAIADNIKASGNIMICGMKPWFYYEGAWRPDKNLTLLRTLIGRHLPKEINTSNNQKRIADLLIFDETIQRDFQYMNKYPDHWICFKDCMVDVLTLERHEHSREYYCLNQIPHNCPDFSNREELEELWAHSKTKRFLETTIKTESDLMMWATVTAHSLTKDTSLQKMLLLTGKGGTGKSTLLNLNACLFGDANLSHLSLRSLSGDNARFSTAVLVGKLVNICADLDGGRLKDVGIIKEIVSADYLEAEYKGGDHFSFKPYVKMWFSANELPMVNDLTDSFTRRLIILNIESRGEFIEDLREALEFEIPLYLYFVLKCFNETAEKTLQKRTGGADEDGTAWRSILDGVHISENSREAVSQYAFDADIVGQFLEEKAITEEKNRALSENDGTFTADLRQERAELFCSFNNWCIEGNKGYYSNRYLFNALRTKGFKELKTAKERYFLGIKLK